MRAILEVNLATLRENYRHVSSVYGGGGYGGAVHAVLKRDAYQLGLARIGPLLAEAGCRGFFVETLSEARRLKTALQRRGYWPCEIYVLTGIGPHSAQAFAGTGISPLIATREELARAAAQSPGLEVGLILETGLGRPGLDAAGLEASAAALSQLQIRHVMSHLADMKQPDSLRNQAQRSEFLRLLQHFPGVGHSLASSAFVFAGAKWHIGAARAGSAILGTRHVDNPAYQTRPAVRLLAPVLSVSQHAAGEVLGYGGLRLTRESRIASIALGYGDGLPAAFWQSSPRLRIAGMLCPLLPELSMMHSFVDVTDLPAGAAAPGTMAEIFGTDPDLDSLAARLGMKPNQLLTQVGGLCQRRYITRPAPAGDC